MWCSEQTQLHQGTFEVSCQKKKKIQLGTCFCFHFSGLISWWRCYANNYLHWGALATWLLLLIQSCAFYGLRAQIRPTQLYGDAMVWYNMFIIFVMYCMLPVPVKWCTVCCLLTTVIHIVVMAIIVRRRSESQPQPHAAWNVFSIGLLYLGVNWIGLYTKYLTGEQPARHLLSEMNDLDSHPFFVL